MDYILKEAIVLDIKTTKDTRDWLSKNFIVDKKEGIYDGGSSSNIWEPILIKTNFDSFFDVLEKEAEKQMSKICQGTNKEEVIKNLRSTKKKIENSNAFNFLKNSSIWMRLCDNDNWDGVVDSESEPKSVKKALEEFVWFEELGLYEFNSAKEFLEYNVRAQKENYIAEIGGHDTHITPMIYSDETKYRDFFLGDDSTELPFKFLGDEKNPDFKTSNVAMRILLIDDKIGRNGETDSSCHKCENSKRCPLKLRSDNKNGDKGEGCKLNVICQLLSGGFIPHEKDCYKNRFKERTYWSTSKVKSYVIEKVEISNVWMPSQDGSKLDISKNWKSSIEFIDNDNNCVQIIGVRDLESALALMSCYKFDIILLDYLLGNRTGGQNGRVYSTELFEFLKFKFRDKENNYKEIDNCPDIVQMFANDIVAPPNESITDVDKMFFGEQFRDEVKLNRGPLDKYWIVPMTSYNSSFIADLQRRNVPLIDYRWNISQGADPINTPWKFLSKLNEFIELQLKYCVYDMSHLLRFLLYTWEDLDDKLKKSTRRNFFYTFQAFMGSEYANFMRRYGNRHIIQRDAYKDESDEKSDKSIFATYIWREFYANHKSRDVIELNKLIQRFLYQAATMHNDRDGQQRLEETFGQLCFFIDINKKVRDAISNENDLSEKLDDALNRFREKMDELTSNRHNENRKG